MDEMHAEKQKWTASSFYPSLLQIKNENIKLYNYTIIQQLKFTSNIKVHFESPK